MTEHGHRKPECIALAERLSEYLDGALPEDLRREVEEHFRGCVRCERFLSSLGRVKELGYLLREPLLSEEHLGRIASRAKEQLED